MRIYVIRHGETNWNVAGRLQGHADTELNEKGIRLAEVTAAALADVPFDFAISSPLSRARRTAEILMAPHGAPVYTDDRLKELSFGVWEGLGCRRDNFELPYAQFEAFYTSPFTYLPPEKGETIRDLCLRTRSFLDELVGHPACQDKTILLATHGCAMRAFLNSLYPDPDDFWQGGVPMNCAVTILDTASGRPVITAGDQIYYSREDCVDYYALDQ